MKKIYFTLIIAFSFNNFTFGQNLMCDGDHRIMMNTYATNLNTVLTAEIPQGITIDQFKKKIVNDELTLSSTAQASILTYAIPLKTYGGDFANAKGLTATTDAYKYFYSSFSPSTVVQNGKLVESANVAGITATEMWTCALESFDTNGCGLSALVSDKSNLNTLATTNVNMFVQQVGNLGLILIVNGFSDCLSTISLANNLIVINSFLDKNQELIERNFEALSLASETELIPLMQNIGFQDVQLFEDILPITAYNTSKFVQTANLEMSTYNLATIEDTPIFNGLQVELGDALINSSRNKGGSKCKNKNTRNYTMVRNECLTEGDIPISGTYGSRTVLIVKIKYGSIFYNDGTTIIECGCGKNGGSWDWLGLF